MEKLIELQNRIYNQNLELGWHDKPRPFNTFKCLFNSELSEAMEGLRKDLMDDHLPHYPMFYVELGDFVIRVFDYLGSIGFEHDYFVSIVAKNDSEIDCLSFLSDCVTDAGRSRPNEGKFLFAAAVSAISFAECRGVNIIQIINEKIEYNKHRADHKRENRAKTGGKKF